MAPPVSSVRRNSVEPTWTRTGPEGWSIFQDCDWLQSWSWNPWTSWTWRFPPIIPTPTAQGAPPFDSHGPAKSEEKPKGVLSEHKTILFDIWFVSIYLLMQKIYLKTLHESHEPTFAWYRYSEHRMNTGLFVSIYLPNKGCKCRMCSSACVCKFDVATAPWSRATAAVTVAWPRYTKVARKIVDENIASSIINSQREIVSKDT